MKYNCLLLRSAPLQLFYAIVMSLSFASAFAEMPQITDAQINLPPPGVTVAAGYFTISNPGKTDLIITSASSDTQAVGKIEIHLSSINNDVMIMRKQDEVIVKAGQSLNFEHGGYHLMLMGISTPLKSGQSIDVQLATSAGSISLLLPVTKREWRCQLVIVN